MKIEIAEKWAPIIKALADIEAQTLDSVGLDWVSTDRKLTPERGVPVVVLTQADAYEVWRHGPTIPDNETSRFCWLQAQKAWAYINLPKKVEADKDAAWGRERTRYENAKGIWNAVEDERNVRATFEFAWAAALKSKEGK